MRIRIVVADRGEARFYDALHADVRPALIARFADPNARLHDRDLKSDRPGRLYDHAPGEGRRGAVAHHATGGERTPRRHEGEVFARRLAAELEEARRKGEFERLVLIAPPAFLGTLRAAIDEPLRAAIACEIDKDLIHADEMAIAAHVPPETFWSAIPAGS